MSEVIYPDLTGLILIQSRVETNDELIEEYAQAMAEDGITFDPVEAVKDGQGNIYVWDGYHRTQAARKVSYHLAVRVRIGTKSEAQWLALSANQKHGLRRSSADKQQVIRLALLHPNGARLSNLQIARHCGVDDKTVARVRREMEASSEIPKIETRIVERAGSTYEQAVGNIGPQPKPHPLRIDQLESAVRAWLTDPDELVTVKGQIEILNTIKSGGDMAKWYLEQIEEQVLEEFRPGDLRQACNNVLDHLRQKQRQEEQAAASPTLPVRNGRFWATAAPQAPKPLLCPLCLQTGQESKVEKPPGLAGLRCTGCGETWSNLRALQEDKLWKQIPQAAEIYGQTVELSPAQIEIRYCPHCGLAREIDLSLINPLSSVGISQPCAGCGEFVRVEAFLVEQPVTPAAFEEGSRELGVGNRGEESSLPTPYSLLPIPFPQGSQHRKAMLQERLGNLAEIIRDCPTDRLYEIEAWFDEIEAAFAALVTAHVTRAEEVWGERVENSSKVR